MWGVEMDLILTIAIIVIGSALGAGLAWRWWQKYDIKVTIFTELAGGGVETSTDYCRIVEGDISMTRYAKLFFLKKELTNVLDKHITGYNGRFKKYQAFLLKAGNGQYYWLDPKSVIGLFHFKPVDYNILNWIRQNIVEAFDRWKKGSWLEKYMPLIIMIVIGLVICGATYIIYTKSVEMASTNAKSMEAVAGALDRFTSWANQTNQTPRIILTG
jgi:hypothetical protein